MSFYFECLCRKSYVNNANVKHRTAVKIFHESWYSKMSLIIE